jgi:sodium transport system permease protein
MLNATLTVTGKELLDHARDSRALGSALLYALMGPAVVGLLLIATPPAADGQSRSAAVLPVMAAVFTLAAAFSGCMSVSMDLVAGERERRSLLPLLVNAVARFELIAGKWLAASVFAAAGALVTLTAFVAVFALSPAVAAPGAGILLIVPPLASLALFAAALELAVSTQCKNVKEANTYLSLLIFVVIGIGMWLAFRNGTASGLSLLLPVVGQEQLLELALSGQALPLAQTAGLTLVTLAAAVAPIAWAASALQRDAIVYGH